MFISSKKLSREEKLKLRKEAVAEREIFITDASNPRAANWADIATVFNRFGAIVREGSNDILSRYMRSFMGPLWNMVGTLVFVIGFMLLGALLLKIPEAEFKPYMVYVTCGVVFWNLIFSIIAEGASMYANPTSASSGFQLSFAEIPVRVVVRNLVVLAFNLISVIAISLFFIGLKWQVILFIPGLILSVLALMPVGIVFGIFGARARDFAYAVSNFIQFGFYLSPVFWRAKDILENNGYPERLVVELNPFHYLLNLMREPFLGEIPAWRDYIIVSGMAVIGWTIAAYVFFKFRRRIIYWT